MEETSVLMTSETSFSSSVFIFRCLPLLDTVMMGITLVKEPMANPFAMANFGWILLDGGLRFRLVKHEVHMEYPLLFLFALCDNNMPSKPFTLYCLISKGCSVSLQKTSHDLTPRAGSYFSSVFFAILWTRSVPMMKLSQHTQTGIWYGKNKAFLHAGYGGVFLLHCQSKLQWPFGDPISASVIWRPLPRYGHSVQQLPFWRHGLSDDEILNGTVSLHSL